MSTCNKKNFSIYTSDERSALGLIEELGKQTNYNTQELEKVKESDNKKVSHDEMNRNYKIDNNANFTGSWHGIEKPTASQEGLQVIVDKIVEQDIPIINSQLDTKASKDDVAKISSGTPLFASSTTEMTDTTKNYVNTTDGYLYIYSGGSWVKTTVQYQSTGVEDKTISTKKLTDDVRISPNSLINLEKNLVDIDYLNNPLSFIN